MSIYNSRNKAHRRISSKISSFNIISEIFLQGFESDNAISKLDLNIDSGEMNCPPVTYRDIDTKKSEIIFDEILLTDSDR